MWKIWTWTGIWTTDLQITSLALLTIELSKFPHQPMFKCSNVQIPVQVQIFLMKIKLIDFKYYFSDNISVFKRIWLISLPCWRILNYFSTNVTSVQEKLVWDGLCSSYCSWALTHVVTWLCNAEGACHCEMDRLQTMPSNPAFLSFTAFFIVAALDPVFKKCLTCCMLYP